MHDPRARRGTTDAQRHGRDTSPDRRTGSAQVLGRVVYASAAAPGFDPTVLEAILQQARNRNRELDVSGMLLFENGSFLQVLEGDPAVVDALYAKIAKDPRHTNEVLLLREAIAERTFGDWSMGAPRVALRELQDAAGVNNAFQRPDPFAELSDVKVRKVLELFRSGSFRRRLG
jgi:Sensors of blue-light using FAD